MWKLINFSPLVLFHSPNRVHTHTLGSLSGFFSPRTGVKAKLGQNHGC